jgi:hypothetical protein
MSDLYSAAVATTTLLGALLVIAYITLNLDSIASSIEAVADWIATNVIEILAFLFLLSLMVTGLSALGVI